MLVAAVSARQAAQVVLGARHADGGERGGEIGEGAIGGGQHGAPVRLAHAEHEHIPVDLGQGQG